MSYHEDHIKQKFINWLVIGVTLTILFFPLALLLSLYLFIADKMTN